MRKDIQNDIDKITFILKSMERKSVFICVITTSIYRYI